MYIVLFEALFGKAFCFEYGVMKMEDQSLKLNTSRQSAERSCSTPVTEGVMCLSSFREQLMKEGRKGYG